MNRAASARCSAIQRADSGSTAAIMSAGSSLPGRVDADDAFHTPGGVVAEVAVVARHVTDASRNGHACLDDTEGRAAPSPRTSTRVRGLGW